MYPGTNLRDQGAALTLRHESEKRDRELVRAALQRGIPEDEIERSLSSHTEFVRLNPVRDALAYVRGLIEEEKDSANALPTTGGAGTCGRVRANGRRWAGNTSTFAHRGIGSRSPAIHFN